MKSSKIRKFDLPTTFAGIVRWWEMELEDRRAQLSDALTSVADGDRDALKTVYHLTSSKLFTTIIRIVRGKERSEDLLQEVFVKVWQRAGRFDPLQGSPITWLCTIARNTALNDIRRNRRQHEIARDELPEVEDTKLQPADDWLCAEEDSAKLSECLDTLKADHRRSIRMAFYEGYTHSELAEIVDVPLGTMKSWIRRGLAGLKGCLDG